MHKSRRENTNIRNNKSNHKGYKEKSNERTITRIKIKYKFKNKNLKIQTQDKERIHRRYNTYGTKKYHIIVQIDQTTSNNTLEDIVPVKTLKNFKTN